MFSAFINGGFILRKCFFYIIFRTFFNQDTHLFFLRRFHWEISIRAITVNHPSALSLANRGAFHFMVGGAWSQFSIAQLITKYTWSAPTCRWKASVIRHSPDRKIRPRRLPLAGQVSSTNREVAWYRKGVHYWRRLCTYVGKGLHGNELQENWSRKLFIPINTINF